MRLDGGLRVARIQATRLGAAVAIFGVATFLAIVIALHLLQPHFDPSRQLMSELALGPYGAAMFVAFAGIAVAFGALLFCVAALGASPALRGLLALAAILFLLAGIFPLGEASAIHIWAIAAAFVASVLAMYLFPSMAGRAATLAGRPISWSLAVGVAGSVALGHSILPIGIGQRLAAAFLVTWISVLSVKLWRARGRGCSSL